MASPWEPFSAVGKSLIDSGPTFQHLAVILWRVQSVRDETVKLSNVESLLMIIFEGLSVLEVIKNEKLISSASMVGKHLQKSLLKIKDK